jgi:hypothetical protein
MSHEIGLTLVGGSGSVIHINGGSPRDTKIRTNVRMEGVTNVTWEILDKW